MVRDYRFFRGSLKSFRSTKTFPFLMGCFYAKWNSYSVFYLLPFAFLLLIVGGMFSCSTPVVPPECLPEPGRDTTSQNWVFDPPVLLGGAQSSALYDVAIVNDSLAYAVGEVYLYDSLGQIDPLPYNLAKWSGNQWELERVTVDFRGNQITPPLEGIFTFSPNEIWLVGSLPIYGDGTTWTMYDLRTTVDPAISVSKAWGNSPSSMYFVGRNGSIARFDGASWQKLESGTTVDLRDVWGNPDASHLWACGLRSDNLESVFLQNSGQGWTTIWKRDGPTAILPYEISVTSLWNGEALFLSTGRGVFRVGQDDTLKIVTLPSFPYKIRGTAGNDVVVVGDNAMVWHWNGATWKELLVENPAVTFYSVVIKDDRIIAVGSDFSSFPPKGYILQGRR